MTCWLRGGPATTNGSSCRLLTSRPCCVAAANRLAATVAAGWFGESFGFLGHAKRAYAGPLAFLAQLELDYDDGTTDVIATDARLARHPLRADRAERHLRRRTARCAPRDRRLVIPWGRRSPI